VLPRIAGAKAQYSGVRAPAAAAAITAQQQQPLKIFWCKGSVASQSRQSGTLLQNTGYVLALTSVNCAAFDVKN
jgi:hypothetical protein